MATGVIAYCLGHKVLPARRFAGNPPGDFQRSIPSLRNPELRASRVHTGAHIVMPEEAQRRRCRLCPIYSVYSAGGANAEARKGLHANRANCTSCTRKATGGWIAHARGEMKAGRAPALCGAVFGKTPTPTGSTSSAARATAWKQARRACDKAAAVRAAAAATLANAQAGEDAAATSAAEAAATKASDAERAARAARTAAREDLSPDVLGWRPKACGPWTRTGIAETGTGSAGTRSAETALYEHLLARFEPAKRAATRAAEVLQHCHKVGACIVHQKPGDLLYLAPGMGHYVLTTETAQWEGTNPQQATNLQPVAVSAVQWHTAKSRERLSVIELLTATGLEHREGQGQSVLASTLSGSARCVAQLREGLSQFEDACREREQSLPAGRAPPREPVDERLCSGPALLAEGLLLPPRALPAAATAAAMPPPEALAAAATPAETGMVDSPLSAEHVCAMLEAVVEDDWTNENTLDIACAKGKEWQNLANQFFDSVLGAASVQHSESWSTLVVTPLCELEEAEAGSGGQALNTAAAVSAFTKGHVTFKHSHHQGVVNCLFSGHKLWVVWPPGTDGHKELVDDDGKYAKRRATAQKAGAGARKKAVKDAKRKAPTPRQSGPTRQSDRTQAKRAR